MPKIVDHDAYREDLVRRASTYFTEHGYAATSMRKIGTYLGVSKGALYHYFPSKESLFLACTEFVMSKTEADFDIPEGDPEDIKVAKLTDILRADFGSEVAIMVEYMRGKSKEERANDEALIVAVNTYKKSVEAIVGKDKANDTLANILGTLLLEYMCGQI